MRIALPYLFRAVGARIPWVQIARFHAGAGEGRLVDGPWTHVPRELEGRGVELAVRWQPNRLLGLPFGPYTVWTRSPGDSVQGVDVVVRPAAGTGALQIELPVVAAVVEVTCEVVDPTHAVGLVAHYVGGGLRGAVAATSVRRPAGGTVTLRLRCSGATSLELTNGRDPAVAVQPLRDVVESDRWEPRELVGLPVDQPWSGTDYDAADQGLVTAPLPPVDAAVDRLHRGGPPLGWFPTTSSGRAAPAWQSPDHRVLVEEVRRNLLPEVEGLFRSGRTPADHTRIAVRKDVDPPSQGTTRSSLRTRSTFEPLTVLGLTAASDPFLALAAGFGTSVALEPADLQEGLDVLVTAEYPDTPLGTGATEVCAFVPFPDVHVITTPPQLIRAERSGLLAPEVRDAPWRESVAVRWRHVAGSAAMGTPTGGVLARFEVGGTPVADPLVERRDAGDLRPLGLVPDGPEGEPGHDWTSMVDADVEIPLGSGGRRVGYPVAVQDVFGVWSTWADARYDGVEPPPPAPRVVALDLRATYAGSTTCPATVHLDAGVDWTQRRPTALRLVAVFYPLASAHSPVPGGLGPEAGAPAGGFRREVTLPFAGEELAGAAGVTVEHLDEQAENEVPPGPDQGDVRRYRLTLQVPALDFAGTRRWGVQVWVRAPLAVVADAGWMPRPDTPATAMVASPVPYPPILPPAPPGVPLGSTPDAQGRSHVRVTWSVTSGAALDPDRGCVVWECSEGTLRDAAGLAIRPDPAAGPGARLAELWAAYDGLSVERRRAVFRRVRELPGTAREADVALPPGSQEIHLFTVTTLSATGVDSPWPAPASAQPQHTVLQSATAPRLRRPAPPLVRTTIGAAAAVTFWLEASSPVPVREFRLHRTRSASAATSVATMGPAFATVPAGPATTGPATEPSTGHARYTVAAPWTTTFPSAWEDWHVRAVAVPVDTVPVEAVRGVPSDASDAVAVRVRPTGPPDLEALEAQEWGPGGAGVLVRTATTAPVRELPDGVHRLSGRVSAAQPGGGPVTVPLVDLTKVDEGAQTVAHGAPTGVSSGPVLVRGPRSGGRTPLALWFTRPVPGDAVDVELRLTDPLGRETVRTVTVPGHVVAPTVPTLQITDVFTVTGRGVVVAFTSDAVVDAATPVRLTIEATPSVRRPGPVIPPRGLPGRPPLPGFPGLPGGGPTVVRPGASERLVLPLHEVPTRPSRLSTDVIQVGRTSTRQPHTYHGLIRMARPFAVRVALDTHDGAQVEARRRVP